MDIQTVRDSNTHWDRGLKPEKWHTNNEHEKSAAEVGRSSRVDIEEPPPVLSQRRCDASVAVPQHSQQCVAGGVDAGHEAIRRASQHLLEAPHAQCPEHG